MEKNAIEAEETMVFLIDQNLKLIIYMVKDGMKKEKNMIELS